MRNRLQISTVMVADIREQTWTWTRNDPTGEIRRQYEEAGRAWERATAACEWEAAASLAERYDALNTLLWARAGAGGV